MVGLDRLLQPGLNFPAHTTRNGLSQCDEGIEGVLFEYFFEKPAFAKQAGICRSRQINNVITYGHTCPRRRMRIGFENAVGKILDGKIRISGYG
jgi:hypothetical protein